MIELLYTTLVLLIIFIPIFFLFKMFQPIQIIMLVFQLLLCIILLSNNFYKKHSLYDLPKFNFIQDTNFEPIKSLYESYYENGTLKNINFETLSNTKFSLIKTEKFSTKCLENYYIEKDISCPITDIKIEKEKNEKEQNYIKINDNEYLYFSNDNKSGKLYKSFNYLEFKEGKEDSYDISNIARKENHKISNPIIDLKNYIKFCDIICLVSILVSLYYTIMELFNNLKVDQFKILNILIQIELLILYCFRFIKFIEVKKFLFDNKDIYDNDEESYFPNKVFNIDSFPLSLSINIFIYNILHFIFPKRKSVFGEFSNLNNIVTFENYRGKNKNEIKYILLLIIPLYIANLILAIFDFINDKKIKNIYNDIKYNWSIKPIKSIIISDVNRGDGYDFQWKNDYYKIEKLGDFNYINIYLNDQGKICGKDNYGNNLYFPYDVDCPINKIYFSNSNEDLSGYQKLKLKNNNYLYYTNQFTDGKIIINFRINSNLDININSKYLSDFWTSVPFYEEIDSDLGEKNSYLFSINYLGIETTSISEKEYSRIDDFIDKIEYYNSLSVTKIVFICCEFTFIIFLIFISKCNGCLDDSCCLIGYIILISCIILAYVILLIISLDNYIKYISGFMYKINSDLKRVEIGYELITIILIYQLLIPIIFLLDIILACCFNINILTKKEEDPSTSTVSVFQNNIVNENLLININIQKDLEIRKLNDEINRIKNSYKKKSRNKKI